MTGDRWTWVLTHLAAAAVGFILGRLIQDIPGMSLDRTIDPIGLTALILSALLSVVFFRRFEKRKHSDQLRKTAVLERLRLSFITLADLEEQCAAKDVLYADVVRRLKKCRREFDDYVGYAGAIGYPVDSTSAPEFRLMCSDLRELLTNTPVTPDDNPALAVKDGRIIMSADRVVEVQRKLDGTKRILFEVEKRIILDV